MSRLDNYIQDGSLSTKDYKTHKEARKNNTLFRDKVTYRNRIRYDPDVETIKEFKIPIYYFTVS